MLLRFRPVLIRDLDECLRADCGGYAYCDGARQALARLWRVLLNDGQLFTTVVENASAAPGRQIVYYNFKTCVTPEFAKYLRGLSAPIIALQALDFLRRGRNPFLPLAEIRRSNGGTGAPLQVVCLNAGGPSLLGDRETAFIADRAVEWAYYSAGGLRIGDYYTEVFGPDQRAFADRAGFHLLRDYSGYRWTDAACAPRTDAERPYLYGVTQAEAANGSGSMAPNLFAWRPARFFFTPAEQQQLLWAMDVDTDEELSEAMNVSLVTVKKRWLSIYERARAAMPSLLQDDHQGLRRGSEKKRRLIRYLRHHMEELRPVERPRPAFAIERAGRGQAEPHRPAEKGPGGGRPYG